MMDNRKLYRKFFDSFKRVRDKSKHDEIEREASKIWKSLKSESNHPTPVLERIRELDLKFKKRSLNIDQFFAKQKLKTITTATQSQDSSSTLVDIVTESSCSRSTDTQTVSTKSTVITNWTTEQLAGPSSPTIEPITQPSSSNPTIEPIAELSNSNSTIEPIVASSNSTSVVRPTPKQDLLKQEILTLKSDILYLESKKSQSIASDEQLAQLKKYKEELKSKETKLRQSISNHRRQQKFRGSFRRKILELKKTNPEIASVLAKRKTMGRPRVEEQQPELLKALVDIATYGCGADEKRRSEKIRSVHTLAELREELNLKGFKIKKSAVYLRLLPRNSNTLEGKRHVVAVPVKLLRSTNDFHKEHADAKFCTATIRYMEELASVLGLDEVLFLSQDDKARVPIGKTAANKQTPLVMHLDYRVRLPDHDWVVAEKHKLILSVYAFVKIDPDKFEDRRAVTFSGPTFITIRSGKHCSSTALSHANDFDDLMSRSEFEKFCKNEVGNFKPVCMITSDGGPDENPRYEKTISCAMNHFKKFNFDVLFLATNAPGRSAFNRVERRMSPLSRDLAGLIHDHQKLGTHLNDQGETIDAELEKRNFEHAGKVLAEIWSDTVIDKFPTVALYVKPKDSEIGQMEKVSEIWKANHVRESHYFLQIVKCTDRSCCSAPRSSYFELFNQFLSSSLCVTGSMKVGDNDVANKRLVSLFLRMTLKDDSFKVGTVKEVPFDRFCPSLKELIERRTRECGIYHGTIKSMMNHKRTCQHREPRKTNKRNGPLVLISRPKRVAAIRQSERMVVWAGILNSEHVDWFEDGEENEVDARNLDVPQSDVSNQVMQVIDIETMMTNLWEEEK